MKRSAKLKQETYSERMKEYYDKGHEAHFFKEGDRVKVFIKEERKEKKTLQEYWDGPYLVTQVRDPTMPIFKVKKLGVQNAKEIVVNANKVDWYNLQGQERKNIIKRQRRQEREEMEELQRQELALQRGRSVEGGS